MGLVHVIFIVYPAIVSTITVGEVYNFRGKSIQLDSFIIVGTEQQRLSLFQENGFFYFRTFFSEDLKRAVIKNVAVLVYLEKGSALVPISPDKHRLQVFWIAIHASCNKRCIGTASKSQRIKGMINASERS